MGGQTLDFDQSVAVVIGINQYGSGIAPLRTAVSDARAIAQLLTQEHDYQVTLLLDEAANSQSIPTFIHTTLPKLITPKSRLLFYFAGHGIAQNGDDGPTGYLIPQDAVPGQVSSYLPMVMLHDGLTQLPCRHFLAIFDCCFAGAFRWSSTRDIGFAPEVIHQERFDRFRKEPAWQVITSASHDQKAMDILSLQDNRGQTGQHSPFAAALLNALQGEADTSPPAHDGKPAGDGVLTATELYMYLRDTVEPLTESRQTRQTPEICALRKHGKGEFMFLMPGHPLNLPPAPPLDKASNPYRGLESFDTRDADLFYGRQALIQDLSKFVTQHAFTVVLGASGTGKSSLVKAGLIPALQGSASPRNQSHPPASPEIWHVLPVIRPGEAPLQALAQALLSLEDTKTQVQQIEALGLSLAQEPEVWIKRVLAWQQTHPQKKLLLVIDQFEEVITLCQKESERQQFFELLHIVICAHNYLGSIVVTLRSDFEPQFLETPLKSLWMSSRFIVPPMDRNALRQVIEQPAAQRVLYFDPPDLIDDLLNEVSQTPGALPLLSFTLSELYLRYLERRGDDRALTKADYEALGGIAGSLTQRATQEYQKLVTSDPHNETTVRNVMLRMVSLEGGELARRRVPKTELIYSDSRENERIRRFLDVFIDARLLVKGQSATGQAYVEPAHDALIRGWNQLLRWQREGKDIMLLQQPLALAIAAREKKQGALWHQDRRLDLLKDAQKSQQTWLNRSESEFVKQSIGLRRRNTIAIWTTLFIVIASTLGVAMRMDRLRQDAQKSQKSAELQEKSARASDLISTGRSAEGLMLSLSTLDQATQTEADYPPSVQLDAQKAIRNTVQNAREMNVLEGHSASVRAVAHNAKHGYIASSGVDRSIQIWDAASGSLLGTVKDAHFSSVYTIAFSPDGQYLVTGGNSDGEDPALRIWTVQPANKDNTTDKTVDISIKHEIKGHQSSVRGVAFHPDGDRIISAGDDKTIRMWDVKTGEAIGEPMTGHTSIAWSVAVSPDGKTIASGSVDRSIKIWDATTGKLLSSIDKAHEDSIFSVAFSPDSQTIVSGSGDRRIRLWDAQTGQPIGFPLMGHDGKVYAVMFSQQQTRQSESKASLGSMIISTGSDRTIRFWNPKTSTQLAKIPEAHSSLIWDLALDEKSNQLISGGSDQAIRLWDINRNQPLGQPYRTPHTKSILSIDVHRDGNYILTAGEDSTINLWDATTKENLWAIPNGWKFPDGHRAPIQTVQFHPKKEQFLSSGNDGTVRLWDIKQKTHLWSTPSHDKDEGKTKPFEIYSAAFSPDGEKIVTGGTDPQLRLWNIKEKKQVAEWSSSQGSTKENSIFSVAFSPDGQHIASAGGDNSIRIWDAKTQTLQHLILNGKATTGHTKDIWSLAFSPDSQYLASGSIDKTVRLWNVSTGEQVGKALEKHTNGVLSVAFSPDGKQLASSSFDRTIQLWNLENIEEPQPYGPPLTGHSESVWSAQFMPDGDTIVSAGADLTLRWWPSHLQQWPKMGCDRLKNHVSLLQSQEGQLDNQLSEPSDTWSELVKATNVACTKQFLKD